MNSTVIPPGNDATFQSVDFEWSTLTLFHGVIYRLLGICVASYVTWQYLLRSGALWNSKSEPPMLPYWIPGLGHNVSFLRDTHKTLVAARNYFKTPSQPFSVLVGGRRTYIILDPRHIAETYKKTKEMLFDAYVDQVMGYVTVSQQSRDIMWNTIVTDTSVSVPNSVRSWVRKDMAPGPSSRSFYEDFLLELDRVLQQKSEFTTGTGEIHGMLKWTGDIIVIVSTNSFFGTAVFEHAPELLDAFHTFNHHAWKLLFRYPKILSKTAHDAKDSCIHALTKYFELSTEKRLDAAPFVLRSEEEMRKHGISSRDIAAVLFKLYWAINGNPSILAFWLLAQTLYTPGLKEELKAEVVPAFKNGIHNQPDVEYLKDCPKMNATFYETMRIHGGASTFRRVVQDTTIAGFEFKAGSDVMMPYRQLHLNEEYWGEEPTRFDMNKFLENPKLSNARTYKPFGGGATLCPGRLLAQQTALTYLAILLTRYDVEVVGGCKSQAFPEMDDKVPTLGIISPVPGQDLKIRVRDVTVE
ncbi:cytochrome P450 [Fusarium avenaceum]|nr:cytochrome P450 [Fusarium avenaceum]